MPTWVAPTIAAEMWRVPLDQVLSRVSDGSLASKTQGGFTFVDVDPYGPQPVEKSRAVRQPTYRDVTPEELTALHAPTGLEPPAAPASRTVEARRTLEARPAEAAVGGGTLWESKHWRDARRIVQQTRTRPNAA